MNVKENTFVECLKAITLYTSKLSDPKDSLKKHTSHFKRD